MNQLEKLLDRITGRVDISLREFNFDAAGYLEYLQDYIPLRQLIKFYAFYGVTGRHPFNFRFSRSISISIWAFISVISPASLDLA
mgnify:CR=1 FL=1